MITANSCWLTLGASGKQVFHGPAHPGSCLRRRWAPSESVSIKIEPVSAMPKWKLENGEQRPAPETRPAWTEMPNAEASIVVEIYRRYLALKSVHALRDALADGREEFKEAIGGAGAAGGHQGQGR
jgi:hypothetical protein